MDKQTKKLTTKQTPHPPVGETLKVETRQLETRQLETASRARQLFELDSYSS